jgi:hypothetical protein
MDRRFSLPRRFHLVVWGALLLLTLLLVAISHIYEGRNVWDGWQESGGLRGSSYAERIHIDAFFRTRANTWSNLAYVVVGFYGWAFAWHDRRQRSAATAGYLVQTPGLSFLFGLGCCWLGAGSGFFHASLTRIGQQVDVASMYAPLLAFIAISLGRWWPRLPLGSRPTAFPTWPILGALAAITSTLLFRYKWSMSSGVVLTTLVLTVGGLALLDPFHPTRRMAGRWMVLASAALIAGIVCRQLDVAGRFSGPDAWFQGHALWHVLTAASIAFTYYYYRSESVVPPDSAPVAPT